jgi:predicted negative regulator of RcsB-dependent stress response
MKAQRRHELEHNKLAKWLFGVLQRVRPYAGKAVLLAAALVAIYAVFSVWRGYTAQGASAAWETMFDAMNQGALTELDKLAEETSGSTAGRWAAVKAADERLDVGCDMLFTNKDNAAQELKKAVAAYTAAIEAKRKGERDLQERAVFGRARAYEALAGAYPGNLEDLDKAVADYQAVVNTWPDGPYGALAKRQLAELQSEQGRKFYDKFAAFKPRPPAPRKTGSLSSLEDLGKKLLSEDGDFSVQPLLPEDLKRLGKTPEKPGAGTTPPAKGEAGKSEPGKTPPPKPEASKSETPKPEASKSETPKPEASKSETPKPEPPKPEPPKPEPSKAAPGKPEPAKPEPAKPEPKG